MAALNAPRGSVENLGGSRDFNDYRTESGKDFQGEIPVLDFEDYYRQGKNEAVLEELARELAWASENVGFYFVRGGPMLATALSLVPSVLERAARLFQLPKPKLQALDSSTNIFEIYKQSTSAAGDSPEVIEQKAAQAIRNLQSAEPSTVRVWSASKGHGRRWGENRFPSEEDVPGFEKGTEDYVAAIEGVIREMLLPVIAKALGLPDTEFLLNFNDPRYFLTLNRYPALSRGEARAGIPMHADNDFLTVLAQDGVPGLQVMLGSGEWVRVPALADCLLVNTGEFLTRITNGRWLNTVHKVVQPAAHGPDRYSTGVFLYPDKTSVVGPLPQFCHASQGSGDLARKYKTFTVSEILVEGAATPYAAGKREESVRGGGRAGDAKL